MRGRRLARCGDCALPPPACVCADAPRLATRTRLVLVMHRHESYKSTNTGRLLVRLLVGATLRLRGERDAPDPAPLPEGRRLVLFPSDEARPLAAADAGAVLLVPDGTWSQARRAVRREPALRDAEPVRLPAVGPSRYGARRAPYDGVVSTFEAVAAALGLLEGPEVERALLDVFARFTAGARAVRAGRFG